MEPTFTYPFSDLYADVSEYIGTGRSPTATSTPEVTAKRRTNDGYREFLAAHDWNFLKRSAIIVTETGKYHSDLPDNFESLVYPFKYPPDSSWLNPEEVDEATIMELRTGSGTGSGRPYNFAIRAKEYSEGEGIKWEVIWHYTPGSVYQLSYTYRIMVNELVNAADIPVCGPEHSQTLRAYCLAQVEAFDEEKPGTFTQKASILLNSSIKKDRRKSARSVGTMGAAKQGYQRRKTVTYGGVQY